MLTHSLDTKRGGGRLASGLVKHLREQEGFKVTVLTTLSSGNSLEESILFSNPIKLLFSYWRVRRILSTCDIVQALDVFPYGILAVVASIGLRKKIVITAIGSSSIQPLDRPVPLFLSKMAYRRADAVTAISSYVARAITTKVPELPIQVIIPGIEYEYFTGKSGSVSTRERPYILSVAKVKPRKGLHISLRAFEVAARVFPELEYVIVGVCEGSYALEIQALVRELSIEDRVVFMQGISDEELVSLYREAELFMLLPQNDDNDVEGFGLVFVEAAAFGLPVIGAKESGAEDAVLDGENGYLVDPLDFESAGEHIVRIMNDRSLRERFEKRSVEFAEACDWKNIIKRYSALYELLL